MAADHIMRTMSDPWGGFANDGHGASRRVTLKAKRKPAKRIGYRECIEYIAWNDDNSMLHDGDPSVVVSMVAHLFDKPTETVIADALRYLEKNDG